jgi:hypothetical protein
VTATDETSAVRQRHCKGMHGGNQDGAYDLSALGWLLFEQLCTGWLRHGAGVEPERWQGSADVHRYVVVEDGLPGLAVSPPLKAPTLVATAWSRAGRPGLRSQIESTVRGACVAARASRRNALPVRSLLLLTNLRAELVKGCTGRALQVLDKAPSVAVLGAVELGEAIEADRELRLKHPFVLGVRRGGPSLAERVRERSGLDLNAAAELARVFVPTRPYARALAVLRTHGFCVHTGPPEMGKTAAARMIGLSLMSAGWEAHECTKPDQVMATLRPDRRQVFVADDAFGSTEYRPDAAERWARALPEIVRATDEHHWLIWTSRPTPLKAALRAIRRERGSERFPAPAEVHVDAADLDAAEKVLILFRHAKATELGARALAIVEAEGIRIVDHPHFTPERIRRFVQMRLPELAQTMGGPAGIGQAVRHEIEHPIEAMAASYLALSPSLKAVLIAMLDCPPAPVAERELAAAARRQAPAGLERAPFELVDRLTDHFLRLVSSTSVEWVHPSWRDLVIAELAGDPSARQMFLSRCGYNGLVLALSTAGGPTGARALPLLVKDADWDALGDRLAEFIHLADERTLAGLLAALRAALENSDAPQVEAELRSLASLGLRLAVRIRPTHEPVGVGLLESWLRLADLVSDRPKQSWLTATWLELLPTSAPDPNSPAELARYEEWLSLAEALLELDQTQLSALGFPGAQLEIASEFAGKARRLLQGEPSSPRARQIGQLLVRAADALGRSPTWLGLAAEVLLEQRISEAETATHLRPGFPIEAAMKEGLVARVLADLRPTAQSPSE